MKRLLILLLLPFFFSAQDIDYKDITIKYTRLPLKPLDKNIKNYQVNIQQEFTGRIEERKVENEKRKKEAEEKYNLAYSEYQKKLTQANVKYQKDLLIWSALPPKAQGLQAKPELPQIQEPQREQVELLIVDKTYDEKDLIQKHLKLHGFNENPENALLIQLFLQGFESQNPTIKTQTKDEKVNDKYIKVTYYQYNVQYKHPLKVKLLSPFSGLIMDEHFSSSLNNFSYTTKEFKIKSELEQWWLNNKDNEYISMMDYAVKTNLNNFNQFLNSQFGFTPIQRSFSIAYIDAKKNYDDYKDALSKAQTAYPLIAEQKSFEQGLDIMMQAIAIWEKALAESNPSSKKARVDENVTEATLYNLAEAYVWINQFAKSNEYLNKLYTFKISNKEKRLASSTQIFCQDQQARFTANQ